MLAQKKLKLCWVTELVFRFPYCHDLSFNFSISEYHNQSLIPARVNTTSTISVRKRFFIQDPVDNSQCKKKDLVHVIVFSLKKTHSWRKSFSFKNVDQCIISVFSQLMSVTLQNASFVKFRGISVVGKIPL